VREKLAAVLIIPFSWASQLDGEKPSTPCRINHIMFVLERAIPRFSLPGILYFSLLSFNECSLFLVLHLAFVFCLDFCSDLVIYLYQGAFRPLVYVGFCLKELFQKGLNGVGKEKKFYDYSGTNGSLFRLWLRLLHVMLDVILIVCLVVFAVV
jgi:hypothetical protein